MGTKPIAIGEALKFGWLSFQGNIVWWLVFFTVVALVSVAFSLADAAAQDNLAVSLLVLSALFILQFITTLAYTAAAIAFADGMRPHARELVRQTYPLLFNFIAAIILYDLIIFAGLSLLIIPGIIWAIKYQFVSYFIIDQKLGPLAALKASGRLTEGVKWELLGFNIVAVLLNTAGTLLFLVGLVATGPTTLVATAYLYRMLQKRAAPLSALPPAPTRLPAPQALA